MAARPNKQWRKDLRHVWEAQQRAAARAKFPLPDEQLRALFDFLSVEFPIQGCDHTLRLTEWWLRTQGLAVEPVVAWLQDNGGFCDCEAAGNAREAWEAANKDVNW
jgi:Protein of unknown function (DUF2695)